MNDATSPHELRGRSVAGDWCGDVDCHHACFWVVYCCGLCAGTGCTDTFSACVQRRYNPQQSLAENTGLSGPLLSRFDAVLVLRDLPEASWDAAAADHILDRRCAHGTASTSMPEQVGCVQGETRRECMHYRIELRGGFAFKSGCTFMHACAETAKDRQGKIVGGPEREDIPMHA